MDRWLIYLYVSYLKGKAPFWPDEYIQQKKRWMKQFNVGKHLFSKRLLEERREKNDQGSRSQ